MIGQLCHNQYTAQTGTDDPQRPYNTIWSKSMGQTSAMVLSADGMDTFTPGDQKDKCFAVQWEGTPYDGCRTLEPGSWGDILSGVSQHWTHVIPCHVTHIMSPLPHNERT